jgi:hypothetical protein
MPFNLNEMLKSIQDMFIFDIMEKKLEFKISVDQSIPQ